MGAVLKNPGRRSWSLSRYLGSWSQPEPNTGCVLWLGAHDKDGYGRAVFLGGADQAHRFSYRAYIGPIAAGLFVCHRCDVTCCINPEHLFLGTPADNTQDAMQKGRMCIGAANANASLTREQAIRVLTTGAKAAELAAEFGVTPRAIYNIRHGWTWRTLRQELGL